MVVLLGIGYEIYYVNSSIASIRTEQNEFANGTSTLTFKALESIANNENVIANGTTTTLFQALQSVAQNEQTIYDEVKAPIK